MPTLNLTYSEANRCFVKSLGYWMNENGDRVPRYFRFPYPNTPEGLRQAQAKLAPFIAQWEIIRQRAKKDGLPPIWFREKLVASTTIDPKVFRLDTTDPRRIKYFKAITAFKKNQSANPVKTMDQLTVGEATEAFTVWVGEQGAKKETVNNLQERLKRALLKTDHSQQMAGFDAKPVVEELVKQSVQKKLRGRSAYNYAVAVKRLCEWYSGRVEAYRLANDWKQVFKSHRFKNNSSSTEVFDDDAEEKDFEVFTTKEIRTMLETATNSRQKLYVLLGLQGAMYFADICVLRRDNVRLARERPFLLYKRTKEQHREPIIQKVWLWKETARLLREEMAPEGEKYALLSEDGLKMTPRGPKETWKRFQRKLVPLFRHRQSIRFKDLRKTGASAVANLSNIDLGELFLGHKVKGVGAKYIKISKARLYSPMMKWEKEVFGG